MSLLTEMIPILTKLDLAIHKHSGMKSLVKIVVSKRCFDQIVADCHTELGMRYVTFEERERLANLDSIEVSGVTIEHNGPTAKDMVDKFLRRDVPEEH